MYKEPVMMFAVKRCVDNGTKPYKFADVNNTPLYHWVTNSSDKHYNQYHRTNSSVNYYSRFSNYSDKKMFWVDDKKVVVPFNVETPIN